MLLADPNAQSCYSSSGISLLDDRIDMAAWKDSAQQTCFIRMLRLEILPSCLKEGKLEAACVLSDRETNPLPYIPYIQVLSTPCA